MNKVILFLFLITAGKVFAQETCAKNIIAPVLSESTKRLFDQKLSEAVSDYKEDSSNADAIIWYGRRTAYTGDYLKAIDLFSKGIALHPSDARMYRHRAHRYITIRCFDKAIADLEKATDLIIGKHDEIEPDGLPNAKNIPTSTLHSNIWYHLGLAYFLKEEYKKAYKAYKRCLEVSNNDDMYVATVNWTYLTLLKLGKEKKAGKLYAGINPKPNLIENFDYWKLLSGFYGKNPGTNEIDAYATELTKGVSPLATSTLNFGIGFYCLARGFSEKAKEYFNIAIATGQWSSFGFIAAEAELSRMR